MQKLDNLFHHIPQFSYIQRPYNRPPEVEIISEAIMLWENCSYSINLGNKNWCYFHSYPSGDTTTVIILANDKKKVYSQDNVHHDCYSAEKFALNFIANLPKE